MVKGEGWGRREGRREPQRSHPQLRPLAGRDCRGSRRQKGRSSGGRAPGRWRVGPRAGRTRARAGRGGGWGRAARRRGRGLGSSGTRLGRLPRWEPGDTVGALLPGAGGAAMLLSGGDPPAQEWFMVQTKSKPRVQRQRLQVQRIFRVKLNAFQSRPDTPYFWLQLEGPKENMSKAKVNSLSPPPPALSSQTPLTLPCPGETGPQRSLDLDSALWRAGSGPVSCLSTSAALVPSLWFPFSFLPHPSPACHFCPSSALREPPWCVFPQEPSMARTPASIACSPIRGTT